jgi:mono/diheme cytochrome c family protein
MALLLLWLGCAPREVRSEFTYGGSGVSEGSEESGAPVDSVPVPSDPSSEPSEEAMDTGCSGELEERAQIECGAAIYYEVCGPCHGDTGEGLGMDHYSDAEISDIILQGFMEMPPQELTPGEAAAVVAFLRSEFG